MASSVSCRTRSALTFSVSAGISGLPTLGLRLGSIIIFDNDYGKALALADRADHAPDQKRNAAKLRKCMFEASSNNLLAVLSRFEKETPTV